MSQTYSDPNHTGLYRDNLAGRNDFERSTGPKYPPHDQQAPVFSGKDIAGLVGGTIIILGSLAAYSLGVGS